MYELEAPPILAMTTVPRPWVVTTLQLQHAVHINIQSSKTWASDQETCSINDLHPEAPLNIFIMKNPNGSL